jgi:hypothetical protein
VASIPLGIGFLDMNFETSSIVKILREGDSEEHEEERP